MHHIGDRNSQCAEKQPKERKTYRGGKENKNCSNPSLTAIKSLPSFRWIDEDEGKSEKIITLGSEGPAVTGWTARNTERKESNRDEDQEDGGRREDKVERREKDGKGERGTLLLVTLIGKLWQMLLLFIYSFHLWSWVWNNDWKDLSKIFIRYFI